MCNEYHATEKDRYQQTVLGRSENLKQELDNLWLMRTPERVENLPSPPYVTVEEEDVSENNTNYISKLVPPMSTLMALNPLYEIMRNSISVELDHEYTT
jgi:hypothetical protein